MACSPGCSGSKSNESLFALRKVPPSQVNAQVTRAIHRSAGVPPALIKITRTRASTGVRASRPPLEKSQEPGPAALRGSAHGDLIRWTTFTMRSAASSTSCRVVSRLRVSRRDDRQISRGNPIATSAGAGSAEPLAQVLPREQATSARDRLSSRASPSTREMQCSVCWADASQRHHGRLPEHIPRRVWPGGDREAE